MKVTNVMLIALAIVFWSASFAALLFIPKVQSPFGARKSITICTWPLIFDSGCLQQFEQETGIKLHITYFETNEELYGKIKGTGGIGYDLLVPTDYMVKRLKDEGYLKPFDKSKLPFLDQLVDELKNNYYDPDNNYALGYFWGVYGIAINMDFFKEVPEASWKLLFDPEISKSPIAMTDAPREAVLLAAQYLFGSIDALKDPANRHAVQVLLKRQKEFVLLYNEARAEDLLLGGSCSTVATLSPEVRKVVVREGAKNIDFLTPDEGTFLFIDSFVIPKESEKDDLVYQFLNFMYRPEVVQHHLNFFGSCSVLKAVPVEDSEKFCLRPDRQKLDFFREVIPPKEIDAIWIDLMA